MVLLGNGVFWFFLDVEVVLDGLFVEMVGLCDVVGEVVGKWN